MSFCGAVILIHKVRCTLFLLSNFPVRKHWKQKKLFRLLHTRRIQVQEPQVMFQVMFYLKETPHKVKAHFWWTAQHFTISNLCWRIPESADTKTKVRWNLPHHSAAVAARQDQSRNLSLELAMQTGIFFFFFFNSDMSHLTAFNCIMGSRLVF